MSRLLLLYPRLFRALVRFLLSLSSPFVLSTCTWARWLFGLPLGGALFRRLGLGCCCSCWAPRFFPRVTGRAPPRVELSSPRGVYEQQSVVFPVPHHCWPSICRAEKAWAGWREKLEGVCLCRGATHHPPQHESHFPGATATRRTRMQRVYGGEKKEAGNLFTANPSVTLSLNATVRTNAGPAQLQ